MSQTIAESLYEEGEAKGEMKGSVRSWREALRATIEGRFGPLPQSSLERINEITDIGTLKKAHKQALKIQKLEDLQL